MKLSALDSKHLARKSLVGSLALCAAQGGAALASGFSVEHQNAEAMGAAYAGAQAKGADAGFAVYNPAALAGIGRAETSLNATVLFGETGYSNASSTLLGAFPAPGAASGDRVLPEAFIAGGAVAFPISGRLTAGITLSTPFGLKSRYDVLSAVRYYAQETSLLTFAVAPTLAYEVSDRFAVGASLKIQYADFTASTVVDAGGVAFLNSIPGFLPGSSDLFAEFKADDLAIGFSIGAQVEPVDGLRLGFTYNSAIDHELDGDTTFAVAGSPAAAILNGLAGLFADTGFNATLALPASYALGASWAATDRLTLLASATLTRWSVFDETVFTFDNPAQPPEVITSEWSDSVTLSAGGEFQVSGATTLRAGFSYDETPVNDAFAGPQIPDVDRRWLLAGVSHAFSEKMSVDLAGGLVVAPKTREVRLDGTEPGNLLRGALNADIDVNTYAASLRIKYRF